MEDELDKYLEVFVVANERGEAPVSTRTSGMDLNVPFPVLPGHLGQYTAGPRYAAASTGLRPRAYVAAGPRYAAPAAMMLPTSPTPAAKAAGGSLLPPSPAMGASPPPPPDSPPPPQRITTNLPGSSGLPGASATGCPECPAPMPCPTCPAPAPCPACPGSSASGMGGGSLLWLLVAAGAGWYLYSQRR